MIEMREEALKLLSSLTALDSVCLGVVSNIRGLGFGDLH